MAGEDGGDLTFEDLRYLQRNEKSAGTLCVIRRDIYPAMIALQERQTRECERYASIDIDDMKYDTAAEKKKKIVSTSKSLVELRMSKVANMALRGAMGALNVVDGLPPEEREFYENVLESAKKLWASRTKKVKTVTYPDIVEPEKPVATESAPRIENRIAAPPVPEPVATEMEPPADLPDDMSDIYIPEEEFGDLPPIPEEELAGAPQAPAAVPAAIPEQEAVSEGEIAVSPPADEPQDDNPYADSDELITIMLLETLPSDFSGLDRDYSLKKEDVVRMPECMASILVRKKLAVRLGI